jgi:rhamnopyranosyl-N-acetylglucosaminyl-diphospho-decaprenol beta-1,3/1,4-galactofuranosyltransferase
MTPRPGSVDQATHRRPAAGRTPQDAGATKPHTGLEGVSAVVVTHRRPRLATQAVKSLVESEGFDPSKVTVVVNGEGGLEDPALEQAVKVVRLGSNQGPAGGFRQALIEAFADPGTRWAYVCEDDFVLLNLPSPRVAGLLERLGDLPIDGRRVGAVVPFGRLFVERSGHSMNFVPRLGSPGDLVDVDVTTWGATLVSREVMEAGILPDSELFFGFEDFDFYCAMREAGFRLLVDVRCARRVAHHQTSAARDAALREHRPIDEEEPWRAYYFARNFFALARRHGHRSWLAWHLLYSARRLQLASTSAERRAILRGLVDGALGRIGKNPRYVRQVGERLGEPPVPSTTAPAGAAGEGGTGRRQSAKREVRGARGLNTRVAALVVSHNAPRALGRCLEAIASQTTPPGAVIVVDNASEPPVDKSIEAGPDGGGDVVPVSVVRSETNLGPAGGWAIAFQQLLGSSYDFAWALDDDIVPDPDCLEVLLGEVGDDEDGAFVFPYSVQPDGSVGAWGAWCGFVVSRHIVEKVGVPRADLFWWAEDNEYLLWRIPKAGFERKIVGGAVVQHDAVRQGDGVPTWKYYYEARNMLYLHLYLKRRVGWYPRNVAKLVGRAVIRERGRRLQSLGAIARGLFDGLTGRLGTRVSVQSMRERHLEADARPPNDRAKKGGAETGNREASPDAAPANGTATATSTKEVSA